MIHHPSRLDVIISLIQTIKLEDKINVPFIEPWKHIQTNFNEGEKMVNLVETSGSQYPKWIGGKEKVRRHKWAETRPELEWWQ